MPLVRGEQIPCVRMQGGDMGSEEHLKMELCSGKGLEMLYITNEIMKQRVSGLGEEHRKLYKFFSDYYRELNTTSLIEDMVRAHRNRIWKRCSRNRRWQRC